MVKLRILKSEFRDDVGTKRNKRVGGKKKSAVREAEKEAREAVETSVTELPSDSEQHVKNEDSMKLNEKLMEILQFHSQGKQQHSQDQAEGTDQEVREQPIELVTKEIPQQTISLARAAKSALQALPSNENDKEPNTRALIEVILKKSDDPTLIDALKSVMSDTGSEVPQQREALVMAAESLMEKKARAVEADTRLQDSLKKYAPNLASAAVASIPSPRIGDTPNHVEKNMTSNYNGIHAADESPRKLQPAKPKASKTRQSKRKKTKKSSERNARSTQKLTEQAMKISAKAANPRTGVTGDFFKKHAAEERFSGANKVPAASESTETSESPLDHLTYESSRSFPRDHVAQATSKGDADVQQQEGFETEQEARDDCVKKEKKKERKHSSKAKRESAATSTREAPPRRNKYIHIARTPKAKISIHYKSSTSFSNDQYYSSATHTLSSSTTRDGHEDATHGRTDDDFTESYSSISASSSGTEDSSSGSDSASCSGSHTGSLDSTSRDISHENKTKMEIVVPVHDYTIFELESKLSISTCSSSSFVSGSSSFSDSEADDGSSSYHNSSDEEAFETEASDGKDDDSDATSSDESSFMFTSFCQRPHLSVEKDASDASNSRRHQRKSSHRRDKANGRRITQKKSRRKEEEDQNMPPAQSSLMNCVAGYFLPGGGDDVNVAPPLDQKKMRASRRRRSRR